MSYTEQELQEQKDMVAFISGGNLHKWVRDNSPHKCENCSLYTDCMSELDSGLVYDLCIKMQGTDEGRFEHYGTLHPYLLHELNRIK